MPDVAFLAHGDKITRLCDINGMVHSWPFKLQATGSYLLLKDKVGVKNGKAVSFVVVLIVNKSNCG
jgi:hypothetical protein